ncbi:MAG TPA: ABC transporter ATP-binding protein, partial [Terracidiphilus sp.]
MALLFDLQDVCFHYDRIPALQRLSLQIAEGESVALLGANGSGKSTLLRILDALCFPAAGVASFSGRPLTPELMNQDGFAFSFRRKVSLVFQNPDVQLFNPTVFDEVAFGPLQLRWPKEEVLSKVAATLELMSIAHLRDRPPYRLSGGEKKRVALASVIVLDPEVLLLDEPTSTLDPRSQSQIIDLIQEWKGSSKTVITATHQLEIVEDIAGRIVVLEEGKVAASGAPAEILSNHELLLRANLVHAHRHSHGTYMHSHPH